MPISLYYRIRGSILKLTANAIRRKAGLPDDYLMSPWDFPDEIDNIPTGGFIDGGYLKLTDVTGRIQIVRKSYIWDIIDQNKKLVFEFKLSTGSTGSGTPIEIVNGNGDRYLYDINTSGRLRNNIDSYYVNVIMASGFQGHLLRCEIIPKEGRTCIIRTIIDGALIREDEKLFTNNTHTIYLQQCTNVEEELEVFKLFTEDIV